MIEDTVNGAWRKGAEHRAWLGEAADRMLTLFEQNACDPAGGFRPLGPDGRAREGAGGWPRALHDTTRIIHCFAVAERLGRPGAGRRIDHGLAFLRQRHLDPAYGGWFWSVDERGPVDASKQAYGHAFVLLAASSACATGHPEGPQVFEAADAALDLHFWEEDRGAVLDACARDWTPAADGYRGQNANMHLTEALMAAFEATGDPKHLARAERIAALVIQRHAAGLAWRVPEHFRADWTLHSDYEGDEMFRPAGLTPGHWLEWSRLLLQLWIAGEKRHDWMPDGAERLFANAVRWGWDEARGGFFYTLDWEDRPRRREKLWWPVAEAIAAAHYLAEHRPSATYEDWYRRFWDFARAHLVDPATGGWRPELTEDLRPGQTIFAGFPDLYHALQATLIPLYPATASLTRVIGA